MNKHPKNLLILLIAEFCDQFSYWGLQSLLVLHLTQTLFFSHAKAFTLYGTFSALTFIFAILGGYVADKLLGFYQSIRIGMAFAIVGNIALALGGLNLMYFGLAFIACGKALFMPSNSNLLGISYQQNESKRDQGFTILYISTNLGALMGPVIYGFLISFWGWQSGFILSVALYIFVQIAFILSKKQLRDSPIAFNDIQKKRLFIIIFCLLLSIIIINYYLLQHVKFTGVLLALIATMVFICLIILAIRKYFSQKLTIYFLLNIMILCLVFFTFELQIYSSLILFVKDHIKTTFLSWNIPVNATTAFEPLAIILLAPFLILMWKSSKNNQSTIYNKLIIGLLLESVSFFIFAVMSHQVSASQFLGSFYLLLIGNLFLGAGEICMMPTTIAAITKFAPTGLRGFLMGTLFLTYAIAGYLDGLIATLTIPAKSDPVLSPLKYSEVYLYIMLCTIAFALLAYLLSLFFKNKTLSQSGLPESVIN